MQYHNKFFKKLVFYIITLPPTLLFWLLLIKAVLGVYLNIYLNPYKYFFPQLSESTVLSLSDNLSNLEITGKSNLEDDRFYLRFCKDVESYRCDSFQNKAIAYISYKNIFSKPITYPATFYYDIIDNCSKYYEISYNSKTNSALCIYGYPPIFRNPFSAKIIIKNDNTE